MHRTRRLAFLAVLATLGGLALAGCRDQPGVAAYVGGHRYTVAQVTGYVQELNGKFDNFLQANGDLQQTVVSLLVVRDLGARIAAERHIVIPPADPSGMAERNRLPADSPLARLSAEFSATVEALSGQLQPVDPSDADQREIYGHLLVNGQPSSDSFEAVKPFLTQDVIGRELALRSVLADAAARFHVTINPLYAPLFYPIEVVLAATRGLTVTSWLSVPFDQPSGPPAVRKA